MSVINEELARRAKQACSFYDYKEGSATRQYESQVAAAKEIAENQKEKVNEYWHDKIDYYFDLYCRKLADNLNHRNSIEASYPSMMIAGPANYNMRKHEKKMSSLDNNFKEFNEIEGLLSKIRSIGTGGISGDMPDAEKLIQDKINQLEFDNAWEKAANKWLKKHENLDDFEYEGVKCDVKGRSYPFNTSYNRREINRLQDRLEDMKASREMTGWKFEGGEVIVNLEANRIQIDFDNRPDDEEKNVLKHKAFKWSPRNKVWQRQLTKNAMRATKEISFLKPITESA